MPLEEKDFENDPNIYKSCCIGQSDKRLLKFIVQTVISLSLVGFSFYMLSSGVDCSEQAVYVSILTSVLSLWLPSPSF
jgi:hypothetical protein